MKYFTYQLFPVGEGAAISPSGLLPEDSYIGLQSGSVYYYYGKANIDSLDIISQFDPREITQAEFDHVYDYVSGFITGSI